jgi:hypothetical protein
MFNKYIVIIASFWLFFFPKGTCVANDTKRSLVGLNGLHVQNVETAYESFVNIVQNDKKKTSNGVTIDDAKKIDENETKPKTLIIDKNAQKNTKQIKPFEPSETIPADQGVDFPYDI